MVLHHALITVHLVHTMMYYTLLQCFLCRMTMLSSMQIDF